MRLMKLKFWLAVCGLAMGVATGVNATEVAGVKLDDTLQLANTELKLNGAGIRYKAIFKVYVAGLYLKEKKTTVQDVLNADGPRRVTLVMMRDLSSEDFSRGFMQGIQKNTDKGDKAKLTSQFLRFGELFASVPELKKGDVMTNDWIPGVGTVVALNGKKMGDPYPDILFYNALLRIWLGESPVDSGLKKAMLGASENRSAFR
ncbi:chalcone isomerase family protein [Undibacterium jejuense]|uniref:Chalcone isomerase family protein n=1 Tax=Undibacterium jejuense TaxID=1344949 RepID=A0A923HLB1_9BURK|nr:chalcone isomerase family protein [Undibacterium jejuense]MBC3863807.1 chalcone isomerase family protein [Undibacterium jejuense]